MTPRRIVTFEDAKARAAAGSLLGPAEMAAIFRVGHAQFNKLRQAGAFEPFKVTPAIGRYCYSGVLVHRYIQCEPAYVPTFGRKRRA